jgi:hypothetical protein
MGAGLVFFAFGGIMRTVADPEYVETEQEMMRVSIAAYNALNGREIVIVMRSGKGKKGKEEHFILTPGLAQDLALKVAREVVASGHHHCAGYED